MNIKRPPPGLRPDGTIPTVALDRTESGRPVASIARRRYRPDLDDDEDDDIADPSGWIGPCEGP